MKQPDFSLRVIVPLLSLKSVIVQRDIIIEEEKRKLDELAKQHSKLKTQY